MELFSQICYHVSIITYLKLIFITITYKRGQDEENNYAIANTKPIYTFINGL